jgi:serine/threonine-protein kinase HipA
MRLARAVGLNAAPVETRRVEGIDFLLIERYDRAAMRDDATGNKTLMRLHQEDFCQALAIAPENKYQSEGGPSLKDCFSLVREVSSLPVLDLTALLEAVIFNLLVGNNDAHGKNFSLLCNRDQTRLAPLYDVLSTAYYPELSAKMAMKIGGESDFRKLTPQHFERLATESGLAKSSIKRRVQEVAERTIAKLSEATIDNPVDQGVSKLIAANCETILQRFKGG